MPDDDAAYLREVERSMLADRIAHLMRTHPNLIRSFHYVFPDKAIRYYVFQAWLVVLGGAIVGWLDVAGVLDWGVTAAIWFTIGAGYLTCAVGIYAWRGFHDPPNVFPPNPAAAPKSDEPQA